MIDAAPLAEAAAFTFGCAVLRARWFEPQRVGAFLFLVAATLAAMLLILITPEDISIDIWTIDPTGSWPQMK